jgi:SAM-dependent methyltransferase
MSEVRTSEEFDKWYIENNGDPWGYESKGIISRLDKTFKHVSKTLKQDYTGTIIELGAFNGAFTKYLANHYKNAQIICNDISEEAINQAKAKLEYCNNIDFIVCDMLSISKILANKVTDNVFLLLESIYYLPCEEREYVIQKIYNLNPKYIFLSAPIYGGGKHYMENEIIDLLKYKNYKLHSVKVLNLKPRKNIIGKIINKLFSELLLNSISKSYILRKKFAGQTLFVMERIK